MIICDTCPRESAVPATVRAAVIFNSTRVQDGESKDEVVKTFDLCGKCHARFVPELRRSVTDLTRRDLSTRRTDNELTADELLAQ